MPPAAAPEPRLPVIAATAGPVPAVPAVAVFIHVATLGRYQEVLDEVLASLRGAGFHERIGQLVVGVVGEGPVDVSAAPRPATVVRRDPDVTAYEFPTLQLAWRHAGRQADGAVLYLNCLGGRYLGADYDNRRRWRELLAFLLIEGHAACLERLRDHDVCGVQWAHEPLPHMTSNNWWARAGHLATLPDPATAADTLVAATDMSRHGGHWATPAGRRRHAAEFWLGMNPAVRPATLFDLQSTGLPTEAYGLVPWWRLRGLSWAALARRVEARRPFTVGQRLALARCAASIRARRIARTGRDWLRGGREGAGGSGPTR